MLYIWLEKDIVPCFHQGEYFEKAQGEIEKKGALYKIITEPPHPGSLRFHQHANSVKNLSAHRICSFM